MIEPSRFGAVKQAINRQCADYSLAILDGNADEREGLIIGRPPLRQLGSLEKRRGADIFDHQRHFSRNDLSDDAFGQTFKILLRICFAPAGPDDNGRRALSIEQGDQSVAHVEKARKQDQHASKRSLQTIRRREELGYLVDPHQRGLVRVEGACRGDVHIISRERYPIPRSRRSASKDLRHNNAVAISRCNDEGHANM